MDNQDYEADGIAVNSQSKVSQPRTSSVLNTFGIYDLNGKSIYL